MFLSYKVQIVCCSFHNIKKHFISPIYVAGSLNLFIRTLIITELNLYAVYCQRKIPTFKVELIGVATDSCSTKVVMRAGRQLMMCLWNLLLKRRTVGYVDDGAYSYAHSDPAVL